jgi:hypothetical protein
LLASAGTFVLGIAVAALACQQPTDNPGSRKPVNPPLHEPPGFVRIRDQPWDNFTRPRPPMFERVDRVSKRIQALFVRPPAPDLWGYRRRASSKDDDIILDATAPHSPPHVLRIIYTPDMPNDHEPSTHFTGFPTVREMYTAWWIKLSPNWIPNSAGGGKITFLWTTPDGQGQVYTNLYHPCAFPEACRPAAQGPPYKIGANTEWAPYVQKIWYPNATTTWINPGEWHRIEFYYKWGTAGDGIIRWWVDGVLNGDYNTVIYPVDGLGFKQFEFAPTVQVAGPQERYMYIDHTYVSTP